MGCVAIEGGSFEHAKVRLPWRPVEIEILNFPKRSADFCSVNVRSFDFVVYERHSRSEAVENRCADTIEAETME
jgi:hypothetical protein